MTGSSLPARATSVRSRAYFSRAANFSSARSSSTRLPLRDSRMAVSSFFRSRPKLARSFLASVAALAKARSMASVATNRSPRPRPVSLARSRKLRKAGPAWGWLPPMALGRAFSSRIGAVHQPVHRLRAQPGLLQHRAQPHLRLQQGREQVLGQQFRMLPGDGLVPGPDQGFVGFLGKGSMAMISLRNPAYP